MDLNVTNTLKEILKAHSVNTYMEGSEIVAGKMSVAAEFIRKPSANVSNLLQLDVRVNSPLLAGRTLIESYAGWGSDEKQAIDAAWHKFGKSSLHVLLDVFVNEKGKDDQVEWETWENQGSFWQVCLGPLLLLGFGDQPPPRQQCGDLIDRLRNLLLPNISQACHWLRLYYMRKGNARIGSECLLDNEPWLAGQEIVDQWHWLDGDYSIRLFLLMLPQKPNSAFLAMF